MSKKIIFATQNNNKLKEINKILTGISVPVISMQQAGYGIEIIEDGKTYKENATKKASTICSIAKLPTLSDDSGVEIAHLGGLPGINASTFLTTNDNYKERNLKILDMMQGATDRSATYICTIALFLPNGKSYFTKGILQGQIAYEPKGNLGFAYDEIFYIPHLNSTLAEIDIQQKNQISHRNIALKKMIPILKKLGM